MIAIISDIHGNLPALEAVLLDIKNRGIKNIICLGDICGYYPYINECIELVKNEIDFCIMGNHDYYIANNLECPRSVSANICLRYQRDVISNDNLNYIKALSSSMVYRGINCVHGGWSDNIDEYFKLGHSDITKVKEKFLTSGHTHIPIVATLQDKIYCNPGSVGQPRDCNPCASFAVFDGFGFDIIRVKYDILRVQRKMKELGFDEYLYKNLSSGVKISYENFLKGIYG